MTNPDGPPYRVTKQEMRAIAANTDRTLETFPTSTQCSIARMRAQMYLTHAGVPKDVQPAAAAEASYRRAFSKDTETQVAKAMGNNLLLRIVKPDKLGREPFPEHLIRT